MLQYMKQYQNCSSTATLKAIIQCQNSSSNNNQHLAINAKQVQHTDIHEGFKKIPVVSKCLNVVVARVFCGDWKALAIEKTQFREFLAAKHPGASNGRRKLDDKRNLKTLETKLFNETDTNTSS